MSKQLIPKHIAVVMDGNGRWAKKRLMPRKAGHKAGAKAVRTLIECCVKKHIKALTLFAFSSENWKRPADEVEALLGLFIQHLQSEIPLFKKHNIKFQVIGDLSKFSTELKAQIKFTEQETADNTGLVLTIAASYGGRWDICNSAKILASKIQANEISVEDIDESLFEQQLCLSDLPEPDLFIRTSGEYRISNFLLWQLSYTELYFTETLWPDFGEHAFEEALAWFEKRHRRFGKTADQLAIEG